MKDDIKYLDGKITKMKEKIKEGKLMICEWEHLQWFEDSDEEEKRTPYPWRKRKKLGKRVYPSPISSDEEINDLSDD